MQPKASTLSKDGNHNTFEGVTNQIYSMAFMRYSTQLCFDGAAVAK